MEPTEVLQALAARLTPIEAEAVERLQEWKDATGSDSIHLREIVRQFPDGMVSITDTIARLEGAVILIRCDGGRVRVHRNSRLETYRNSKGKKCKAVSTAEFIDNDPTDNYEFEITSRLVTLLDLLADKTADNKKKNRRKTTPDDHIVLIANYLKSTSNLDLERRTRISQWISNNPAFQHLKITTVEKQLNRWKQELGL